MIAHPGRKPDNRKSWLTPAMTYRPTMSPFALIAAAPVKVAFGKSKVLNWPPLSR